jgi:hypothetical protein
MSMVMFFPKSKACAVYITQTYLSCVKYHTLAVREDADRPRRELICLAIEGDSFIGLIINVGKECRTN